MGKMIVAIPLLFALAAPGVAQARAYADVSHEDVRAERRDVVRAEARLAEARADLREQRRDVRDTRGEWREEHRKERWNDNHRTHELRIGSRIAPAYLDRHYRLTAREARRLPPIRPNQAYVRVHGKVALVNLRTGRVVALYGPRFG